MSVLIINGSTHEEKCTYTGLKFVKYGLEENGIDAEIVWIGNKETRPCISCLSCRKFGVCAFGDKDGVNSLIIKATEAQGIVIGSPVFFAGINGALKCTLDRMFYAAASKYEFKPGAALVSARRAGTTAALEQINKYFGFAKMPQVGSFYWPMVHGNKKEDVVKDEEGTQIAYQLGANMAWLIKSIEAGKEAGLKVPVVDDRPYTNFIR